MGNLRRDVLKRRVEKGLYEACLDFYICHDDSRYDETSKTDNWLPARITSPTTDENGFINSNYLDGFFNFSKDKFQGNSGRAWDNNDGIIILKVHSNLYYKLRLIK